MSEVPQIAFVGSDYYQQFAARASFREADLLRDCFAERGYRLQGVRADDPAVHWPGFAAVLPLGFWGYHRAPAAFAGWIGRLEQDGVRLINPPSVLRWNQDKAYLVELAQAGAQVAPMRHFPVGSQVDLRQVLAEAGWEDYVLKPSISANAENSLAGRGAPDAASVALAERILGHCGLLVQPLFPEILAEGEWSLIFADEDLVHAVLKRPRAGDFRSQPDHGGTVLHQLPSREVMAQAQATLGIARALLGPLAYARVDGFVRDGRFYLIELELIEPYLFLQGAAAEAPRRLVDAILRALSVASP